MNRQYMKPTMQVMNLRYKCHILSGSNGAKGMSNAEDLKWVNDGVETDDM